MTHFKQKLSNYAKIAVEIGANVQPGQILHVRATTDTVDFVRLVVEHAYRVGAKRVDVDWSDDSITKLRYALAPDGSFDEFPEWKAMERTKLAEQNATFMSIISDDPDLLNGVDPVRVQQQQKASSEALRPFYRLLQADAFSWTVIAAPSVAWAKKMFPTLSDEEAMDALWEAIFKTVRADEDDAVVAWKAHDATLHQRTDQLNELQIETLHYEAPGTSLSIGLPDGHLWTGGSSVNKSGTRFMANMPTEEVFTVPHRERVNGTVASTKPLSYNGTIIEDFSFTFQDGKVVDYHAERGEEALTQLLETDEGSRFLGEVALVPHDSPISNMNVLFYNTLFDENASNHLALGSSYTFCLEGGKEMTVEQTTAAGLNESLTHVDFMIGCATMSIDATLKDGRRVPIFREGNWAFS